MGNNTLLNTSLLFLNKKLILLHESIGERRQRILPCIYIYGFFLKSPSGFFPNQPYMINISVREYI